MQKSFAMLSIYLSQNECAKLEVFWAHLIDLDIPSYKILLMHMALSRQDLQHRQDLKIYIAYKILTEKPVQFYLVSKDLVNRDNTNET